MSAFAELSLEDQLDPELTGRELLITRLTELQGQLAAMKSGRNRINDALERIPSQFSWSALRRT